MAKTSKYFPAAVVAAIIIIVAGAQYFKKSKPTNEVQKPAKQGQEQSPDQKSPVEVGALIGTLKISDNLKRGSLMLATEERAVYLFTSRDYSALLGKEVKLQIDGTLENFRLIDIVAK